MGLRAQEVHSHQFMDVKSCTLLKFVSNNRFHIEAQFMTKMYNIAMLEKIWRIPAS